MSRELSFIDKCIRGQELPDGIDGAVQAWHDDASIEMELSEYIGLTEEEYSAWLLDSSVILSVITARTNGQTFDEYIKGAMALPLAARGQGLSENSPVVKWLRRTGRIK
ncbi:hypothetical protein [Stenotrophomonas sp. NA06056]|uniref:hypothetical protein n=1 Tax=Stenotrophomonas sp. NA06056 TaxID=2742129 RepID=UPI0015883155|nr:hypothetical protein [Stenotrophomonas sp. NA06056]QKW58319.1 hypothetical protein HUT07_17530 [Stenotrophomonas sp. NA06056]